MSDNDYDQVLAEVQGAVSAAEEQAAAPQPLYTTLQTWVDSWFRPMFARHLGPQLRWCDRWWAHEEAVMRLDNLWFTWEFSRTKPGVGLTEWLQIVDQQLQLLMGAQGPFSACERGEHNAPAILPGVEPPSGWWEMDPLQRDAAMRHHNRRLASVPEMADV